MSASNIILPWTCLPLCDGVVEVYERVCCCPFIVWDDLIDRLRDILDDIPVEIDWPVPRSPIPALGRGFPCAARPLAPQALPPVRRPPDAPRLQAAERPI